MPSRRTSFEYTRVIANAARRLPDLRLALSAKSVPGACTLAATDRADAEVSAESRRATGSTNQRPRIRPTAAVTTLPLRSELIPEQKPAARTRSGDEPEVLMFGARAMGEQNRPMHAIAAALASAERRCSATSTRPNRQGPSSRRDRSAVSAAELLRESANADDLTADILRSAWGYGCHP